VPEQLADGIEAIAAGGAYAGEAVAQVVQSHIVQAGATPNPRPHLLQADEMPAARRAWEYVRVAVDTRQVE
jgi:hypothetical protein